MTTFSPVKVACVQMETEPGEKEKNLDRALGFIDEACRNGAQLIILPELFTGHSKNGDRAGVYAMAEPVPEGGTTARLAQAAVENRAYICGSFYEIEGKDVYNTSVLVGPEGYIGKYRKLHPCGNENYIIEPGNLGIPVFHTEIGRIALNICLDAYYPETFRIAALHGADIVCCQFASSDVKEARGLPDPFHTLVTVLCMANAVSNHIFTVCCNNVGGGTGGEYGSGYAGQSAIINPWGAPVSGIASTDKEEILYADIDLTDARKKHFHPANSRLAGRRTDVYSADLGYDSNKYKN